MITDRRETLKAMRLITLTEVAATLGATRQRANVITKTATFPEPAGRVGGIPVWFADEVETWAATWERRPGRPARGN